MKKGYILLILVFFIVLLLIFSSGIKKAELNPKTNVQLSNEKNYSSLKTFKIASWNIQVFGKAKWEDLQVRQKILDVIRDYDIIFIQEVRDSTGIVFNGLCKSLADYKCIISSRAGRTSSKEQYLVLHKQEISAISATDYSLDGLYLWERPPFEVTFNVSGYIFMATTLHTKPGNVSDELKTLETLYLLSSWQGNRVWLGDFNADGAYYDEENKSAFISMYWVVNDNDDTTVAASSNAYDRILINGLMENEFVRYGIYRNVTKNVSDHYLVWAEFNPKDI